MNEEWWIFTFGCGQENAGKYVKIKGSFSEAREKMVEKYGTRWCFQYSLQEWQELEKKAKDYALQYPLETLLEIIE